MKFKKDMDFKTVYFVFSKILIDFTLFKEI